VPPADVLATKSDAQPPHSDRLGLDAEGQIGDAQGPEGDRQAPESDAQTPKSDGQVPPADVLASKSDAQEPHSDPLEPDAEGQKGDAQERDVAPIPDSGPIDELEAFTFDFVEASAVDSQAPPITDQISLEMAPTETQNPVSPPIANPHESPDPEQSIPPSLPPPADNSGPCDPSEPPAAVSPPVSAEPPNADASPDETLAVSVIEAPIHLPREPELEPEPRATEPQPPAEEPDEFDILAEVRNSIMRHKSQSQAVAISEASTEKSEESAASMDDEIVIEPVKQERKTPARSVPPPTMTASSTELADPPPSPANSASLDASYDTENVVGPPSPMTTHPFELFLGQEDAEPASDERSEEEGD
jgi:hypothetical protein